MILLLSLAYLLSGLCALIYETVWIYQFSRVFGSTVLAMSLVVAVFFGGLAAGARFYGKVATKTAHPLRLYAILELGIAAYALAFPLLLGCAERAYAGFYPALAGSFALMTLTRALLALLVIFPPTVLMGGSLPVLLTCCADRLSTLGQRAGLVYGLNTLGAALGSFLAGYVLLEALGVKGTNTVAGLLNLGIGLLALVLSFRWNPRARDLPSTADPAPPAASTVSQPANTGVVIVCFAVSGFVSMAYETVWLRYLAFYFHETIYLYAGILTIFILGIGLGSLVGGWAARKVVRLMAFFGLLQAGIGVLTFLSIHAPIPFFQPIYDAGLQSNTNVLLILAVLLLPPALLMGAVFPVVTRLIVPKVEEVGHRVGSAYAWNTLGGILGLLCTGFLFQSVLGLQWTMYLLFITNLLTAAVLLRAERNLRRRWLAVLPLAVAAAGIVAVCWGDLSLPRAVMSRTLNSRERIVTVEEGPVSITWATQESANGTIQLWENGVRVSRNGRSTCQVQGFIPMLLKPVLPRDVLGLAFGAGLSYRAARQFPEVRRLDFVDISQANMDVALRVFPENEGLREDPRARFVVDDAYSYVKYSQDYYDLILMEPTPPRYGYQTASLYTLEFYWFARRRLNEGGLFAQVLSMSDHSPDETAGIMQTFASIFPYCLLWRNAGDCVMLGSEQELRLNLRSIAERLSRPEVQQALHQSSPPNEHPYRLDHFLSGLLLVDRDFRRAASGGAVFTNDRSTLRHTTGRNITLGNVRRIHENLTPWSDIQPLAGEFPELAELLTKNRAYSMALMYSRDPEEFRRVFLKYVEEYPQQKEEDLKMLRVYLKQHGLKDQVGVVEWLPGDTEKPGTSEPDKEK